MANATVTVKPSGGDYTSLNAALAGEAADLTSNCHGTEGPGILTIECYPMEDTTPVADVTGYTTSPDYYVDIRPAGNYWLPQPDDRYKLKVTTDSYARAIYMSIQNFKIRGLLIVLNMNNSYRPGGHYFFYYYNASADGNVMEFSNNLCIIEGAPLNAQSGEQTMVRFSPGNNAAVVYPTIKIHNNIIINNESGYGAGYGDAIFCDHRVQNTYISNNTIVNWTRGTYGDDPDRNRLHYCKNNLFVNCPTPINTGSNTRNDYNATDAAAIGYSPAGVNDRVSQTITFVDADNDNYRLASNDAGARGYGIGPASNSYMPTTDICGYARRGSRCNIGAHEYGYPIRFSTRYGDRLSRRLR